jgi:hypothetical protein
MASPVFGFLPVLPFRWDTEKVPKPEIFTFSLFFKAAQISSNSPPTISSALCRGSSNRFASESIKSAFVIVPPHHPADPKKYRAIGFYNSRNTGCQTTRYCGYNDLLRQNLRARNVVNFSRERRGFFLGLNLIEWAFEKVRWIVRNQGLLQHLIHMRN